MDDVVTLPPPSPAGGEQSTTIDITSDAFARRLGNLLAHRRTGSKLSLRHMARSSNKHFTRRDLRRYEAGEQTLDAVTAAALASLYKVDLATILPTRTDLEIDRGGGILRTGGVDATFEPGDPDSILETYLRLVRRLRNQERDEVISLRREDVEGLAAFLGRPGETVIEQLGALMGATKTQRRLMAGMFITGAMVITVAAPGAAALMSDSGPNGNVDAPSAAGTVTVVEHSDVDGEPSLDGPDPAGPTGIGNTVLLHDDAPTPAEVREPSPGDDGSGPTAGNGATTGGSGSTSAEVGSNADPGEVEVEVVGTGGPVVPDAGAAGAIIPDLGSGDEIVGEPGSTPIPAPVDDGGLDDVSTGAPPIPVPGDAPVVEMPIPADESGSEIPAPADEEEVDDPAPDDPPPGTDQGEPTVEPGPDDELGVGPPLEPEPEPADDETPAQVPDASDDPDTSNDPVASDDPDTSDDVDVPDATDDPVPDETDEPGGGGSDPAASDDSDDDEKSSADDGADSSHRGSAALWVDGSHLIEADPDTGGFRTGVWGFSFVEMAPTTSGTLTLEHVDAAFGRADVGQGGWAVVVHGTPDGSGGLISGYTVQFDFGYGTGALVLREWVDGRERTPVLRVDPTDEFSFSNATSVVVTADHSSLRVAVDGTSWIEYDELRHTEGVFGVRTWHGTNLSAGAATLEVPSDPSADDTTVAPAADPPLDEVSEPDRGDDSPPPDASATDRDRDDAAKGPVDEVSEPDRAVADDTRDTEDASRDTKDDTEDESRDTQDEGDERHDPDQRDDPAGDQHVDAGGAADATGLDRAQQAVGDGSTVLETAHANANPNANPRR